MWLKAFVGIVALAGAAGASLSAPVEPEGNWRMTNGKLTVKVGYCNAPRLCATVIAMRRPFTKDGKPKTDIENPDPSLRARPIIGLEIMSGMKPDGENRWKGKIYNADDGNIYDATARFEKNELLVKGCWTFFCKKLHFKRLPPPEVKESAAAKADGVKPMAAKPVAQ